MSRKILYFATGQPPPDPEPGTLPPDTVEGEPEPEAEEPEDESGD